MTKDEALKLALEALKAMQMYAEAERKGLRICDEAITAVEEALAQREQDGECKYCTDGCPACDARKLPKEAYDLF